MAPAPPLREPVRPAAASVSAASWRSAPYRSVAFPPVDLEIERRADGVVILTPRQPLEIATPSVPAGLARQAERHPDRPHLSERPAPGQDWRRASFGDVKRQADSVTEWLLALGCAPGRPLLIVSGNSIAHAVMRYGAMGAGVPVCPVSANYALIGASSGYERLAHVIDLVRPAVIFAETGAGYASALDALSPADAVIVSREPGAFLRPALSFDDVANTPATGRVAAAIAALDPHAPAAYMLTSGSTGKPKAVIQTQRMITANLHQGWQTLGRAAGWDDTLLEWLPWSHVSGAFSSMAAAIFGGSFHIDAGKPAPGLFDQTLANLREIPLRYFTNVPAGYGMLVEALEADPELCEVFFRDLRLMLYGGAGLTQPVYDRLQALAVRHTGARIFLTTGYGATETTSGCMSIYFDTEKVGIGLPMPGLSVKLTPDGDRFEVRMKGEMVTPGYLGRTDNDALFDAEGFYKIGDTARFHDQDDPTQGLVFAGRLAEEFKLATGTWVSGGELRGALLNALGDLVSDLLVCGENAACVGVLAWPNRAGLAALARAPDATIETLCALPEVMAGVQDRLTAHNLGKGSAASVGRFAFLLEPPSADAHELSDKGAVNQILAKRRRAADVARLYAAPDDAKSGGHVLIIAPPRPAPGDTA